MRGTQIRRCSYCFSIASHKVTGGIFEMKYMHLFVIGPSGSKQYPHITYRIHIRWLLSTKSSFNGYTIGIMKESKRLNVIRERWISIAVDKRVR